MDVLGVALGLAVDEASPPEVVGMEVAPDALVVVTDGAAFDEVVARLRDIAVVTQLLPPRLALVALPPEQQEAPPVVDGATLYIGAVPAPPVLAGLSTTEQDFVAAWAVRLRGKVRTGDRLPWDAPGHLPPDGPPPTDGVLG